MGELSAADMRRRTGRKWRRFPADVLPAWIADMDFAPAPCIRASLAEAIELGDLGYGPTAADSGVPEAFAAWAARRWGWSLQAHEVLLAPDVISGLYNCIEALTEPGEAVLVQTPIYGPFLSVVRNLGRRLVEAPLDRGGIDFAELERIILAEEARMILLCNPHNPTGRVFSATDVARIAALAQAHDIIVVSDEVHADLVFDGRRHIPFASASPDAAARCITLNSPSKAFNVAGLRLAVAVVGDAGLRACLTALPPSRWTPFSTLGVRAALAAWSQQGEAWLAGCVERLQANRDLVARRLAEDCPGVRSAPPEASYLAWLDFTALDLGQDPAAFLLDTARVALSPGPEFGAPGEGHARLNFATSPEVLNQILDRIATALAARP